MLKFNSKYSETEEDVFESRHEPCVIPQPFLRLFLPKALYFPKKIQPNGVRDSAGMGRTSNRNCIAKVRDGSSSPNADDCRITLVTREIIEF